MPCGPIYSIDQVFADPQVEHLGMAQPVKTKGKSSCAWRASRCRCRARRASWWRRRPTLGEHTDEVLKEFGFSAKEIAALRKANAV